MTRKPCARNQSSPCDSAPSVSSALAARQIASQMVADVVSLAEIKGEVVVGPGKLDVGGAAIDGVVIGLEQTAAAREFGGDPR